MGLPGAGVGVMGMTGRKAHVARLKRLSGPTMEREVGKALFAAGEMIQVEAQLSITRGAVSGKNHVASRPGEAPNQDSGVLANNIETTQEQPLVVQVTSSAPYSTALEFGTTKMAARPFMAPARDRMRRDIEALIVKAVKRVVGRR